VSLPSRATHCYVVITQSDSPSSPFFLTRKSFGFDEQQSNIPNLTPECCFAYQVRRTCVLKKKKRCAEGTVRFCRLPLRISGHRNRYNPRSPDAVKGTTEYISSITIVGFHGEKAKKSCIRQINVRLVITTLNTLPRLRENARFHLVTASVPPIITVAITHILRRNNYRLPCRKHNFKCKLRIDSPRAIAVSREPSST